MSTQYVCLVVQSCLTICYPMDYSLPGSSVHGIFQARILEWVDISFSRGSFWPRVQTWVSCSSCIAGRFFTAEPSGKPRYLMWLVARSCLTLCDPMGCSPSGSSVHGILQARTQDWIPVPSSRGSSQSRDWTRVSCISCNCKWNLYPLSYLGSPNPAIWGCDVWGCNSHLETTRETILHWGEQNGICS